MINILSSSVISNLYTLKYKSVESINGGITLSPGVGKFSTLFDKYKSVLKIVGALAITGFSINLP